jgi:hypothetical protein
MSLATYVSQRSAFTRWFVPIGFAILAGLSIWQQPRWSWANALYISFALATWTTFALHRRRGR